MLGLGISISFVCSCCRMRLGLSGVAGKRGKQHWPWILFVVGLIVALIFLFSGRRPPV